MNLHRPRHQRRGQPRVRRGCRGTAAHGQRRIAPVDGDLDGDGFAGADFEFLAANVVDDASGETLFPAVSIKEYDGVEVAFIGMTLEGTPIDRHAIGRRRPHVQRRGRNRQRAGAWAAGRWYRGDRRAVARGWLLRRRSATTAVRASPARSPTSPQRSTVPSTSWSPATRTTSSSARSTASGSTMADNRRSPVHRHRHRARPGHRRDDVVAINNKVQSRRTESAPDADVTASDRQVRRHCRRRWPTRSSARSTGDITRTGNARRRVGARRRHRRRAARGDGAGRLRRRRWWPS